MVGLGDGGGVEGESDGGRMGGVWNVLRPITAQREECRSELSCLGGSVGIMSSSSMSLSSSVFFKHITLPCSVYTCGLITPLHFHFHVYRCTYLTFTFMYIQMYCTFQERVSSQTLKASSQETTISFLPLPLVFSLSHSERTSGSCGYRCTVWGRL